MANLTDLIYVGTGGFIGANARFVLSAWVAIRLNRLLNVEFPYGTLFVNVVGSFGLAVLSVWLANRSSASDNVKLLIGTGFFGAFTTFSTYTNESVTLFKAGQWVEGVSNILLNNGLCVVGVLLGLWIANR